LLHHPPMPWCVLALLWFARRNTGLLSKVDGNVSMILTIMAFFMHPVFKKLWFPVAFPLFLICWDQSLHG
jgi:hypothetical protein